MALTRVHNRMVEGAVVNVLDYGAVGDGITDDTAAIQAAIDSINSGGVVNLPAGLWLISDTIVVSRGVSIIGAARSGGQRGSIVNHPCTIKYTGIGSAFRCGSSGDNGISIFLDGFSIVAESGDANYQNFVGFEFYDFRNSIIGNLYVEGADVGYKFTGEGGAIVFCDAYRLNAYDCNTGIVVDCPTPIGGTSPFIQALTIGVGEITGCGTGVHLSNGQQNHNKLISRGGEIGANTINIHVDGDDNGSRLTWTLTGPFWFEGASGGNIVLDAGTVYADGDITNSDNNVDGGFIQNGGRLIPLGRSSFDDYSLPLTGFTSNGLARVWSFVDEGDNNFHCPLTGARAAFLGSGATFTNSNTRFGDGIFGGGSGGIRIYDTSFDWTSSWTVAVLIHTPSTSDSVFLEVQKNTGPSFLELSARPGFVRVRTRDNGAAATQDDLGATQDNPIRSPFWFVVSYDASTTEFQFRAPNGEAIETVVRSVPAALSSGGYDAWHAKDISTFTSNTIDELAVWDRVLTNDEVMAIYELRTNLIGAIGRDPRDGIIRKGSSTNTTDANGEITIAHGLLATPAVAFVTVSGDNQYTANVISIDATNVTVLIKDAAGSDVTSTSVTVYWRAEI